MYDQIREDFFFIMIYSAVTTTALMASCYLLFRRGNAFAPDIRPPARLRRWTAVFFALIALSHIWYLPLFWLTSDEDVEMADLVGGLLDCIAIIPLAIALLIVMLQDRRRPLWPVAVVMAPLVVDSAYSVATRSDAILQVLYAYFLLLAIGTNRSYLSQYFSSQHTTYNAYINDLRINHFVSLYRESIADKRDFTVQQLAQECGYRSYSTFSRVFKQQMGKNVATWIGDIGE